MLASSFLRLSVVLLVSLFLIDTIQAKECARVSQHDIDHLSWDKQSQKVPQKQATAIDAEHDSYKVDYTFEVAGNKFQKWWSDYRHHPKFDIQASILKHTASVNSLTDLRLASHSLDGTYRWKHPFRVEFQLKNNQAVSYWLDSLDFCTTGGQSWQGHDKVPFFAEDVAGVMIYKKND